MFGSASTISRIRVASRKAQLAMIRASVSLDLPQFKVERHVAQAVVVSTPEVAALDEAIAALEDTITLELSSEDGTVEAVVEKLQAQLTKLQAKRDRLAGRHDWLPGISEPEDAGLQVTPEVTTWGGSSYNVNDRIVSRDADGKIVATFYYTLEKGNPFRLVPIFKKSEVAVSDGAVRIRTEMHDAEVAWCHRDQSDGEILRRWNQPDDVLDELDAIEQSDQREVWVERMTAFREAQLRRMLKTYFGADDYMNREIVLKWERQNGRWVPAQKMVVKDWVAQQIEQRGSRLAGFSACAGTMRSKITRKAVSRDARHNPSWWKTYNAV